jgi:hypothetical protein
MDSPITQHEALDGNDAACPKERTNPKTVWTSFQPVEQVFLFALPYVLTPRSQVNSLGDGGESLGYSFGDGGDHGVILSPIEMHLSASVWYPITPVTVRQISKM